MLLHNITLLLKYGTFERSFNGIHYRCFVCSILLCKNIDKYYADYFQSYNRTEQIALNIQTKQSTVRI